MQSIPFYRPSVGQAEIDEVVDTLRSGWLTTGPKTSQFEREFAAYVGRKHAVAVNSCTAALHLALEAIGLKSGDAVVVPTMTFAATAEVVRYFNAQPLLVDCRSSDLNLDLADAEKRVQWALDRGQRVAAIIPVHYGGQIGDMSGVIALARKYRLCVIEDAAHCCPAFYRETEEAPWKPVGAESDMVCFSFYANKSITTGEGGMVCTDNEAHADRIRIMSLHGISKDAWKRFTAEGSWYYEIVAPGYKYNLTDIAAAIGIHQLRRADELHCKRTALAEYYTDQLQSLAELEVPRCQPNRVHSWHLYAVRLRLEQLTIDRARFIEQLKARGVATSVHWMPLHMHPYYREIYGYAATDFPVAAGIYPRLVTLPLFPDMTLDQANYVVQCIRAVIAEHRR
jgi:perosamine synthetase